MYVARNFIIFWVTKNNRKIYSKNYISFKTQYAKTMHSYIIFKLIFCNEIMLEIIYYLIHDIPHSHLSIEATEWNVRARNRARNLWNSALPFSLRGLLLSLSPFSNICLCKYHLHWFMSKKYQEDLVLFISMIISLTFCMLLAAFFVFIVCFFFAMWKMMGCC